MQVYRINIHIFLMLLLSVQAAFAQTYFIQPDRVFDG